MNRAAKKYLDLITELRMARLEHELRGEALTQADEVEYLSELDHWWREMTGEEQDAIESQLAGATPDAPTELPSEDVDVLIGSENAPRREAA